MIGKHPVIELAIIMTVKAEGLAAKLITVGRVDDHGRIGLLDMRRAVAMTALARVPGDGLSVR
jgi:hypothetical protein